MKDRDTVVFCFFFVHQVPLSVWEGNPSVLAIVI